MQKILKIFSFFIIIIFFYFVFTYYLSTTNAKKIELNRANVELNLKNKLEKIPVLENNTEDIIEFNSSFSEEIKSPEPRKFWNLLKIK